MNAHFRLDLKMEKDIYTKSLIQLGRRIREIRKGKGMTQVDLEFECHINHGDISRIENGQKNIEFHTIVKLAAALKVELYELFKDDTST